MPNITSIDQLDFSKRYTYADYLQWKFDERVELIKGFLHRMSPAPNRKHQKLAWNFTHVMSNYFVGQKCEAYGAPFDVRLLRNGEQTVLQPDICVICDLSKLDDQGCNGAPDLVIEILSPGNSEKEMKLKFDIYEESGVKEYWVVQPEYNLVLTYIVENGRFVAKHPLTSSDKLVSHVFPDLEVDLQAVFAE